MKRQIKLISIAILIVLFCIMLTGCGEKAIIEKIKEVCTSKTLSIGDELMYQAQNRGETYIVSAHSNQINVNYNNKDKSFSCVVPVTIRYSPSIFQEMVEKRDNFSFSGHIEKSEVIIDWSSK